MRGAKMCLLVACVVSVAAQLDDLTTELYLDDDFTTELYLDDDITTELYLDDDLPTELYLDDDYNTEHYLDDDLNTKLYFNDANITKSIPSDWNITNPSTVERIKVNNINVDKIEANAFENFTSLKELDLTGKINGIEDGAFRGLTKIEKIKLEANDIQNIGPNVFSNLNNLKWLNIDRNKIKEIRLNKLTMLEDLNLSHNEITELNSDNFIDLQKLVYIKMDNNKIRSIKSGTFSGCPNLIELYLYDNQLADIEPDAFRDLHKFEKLILRNNNLKTITPNHFIGLTSLKKLDLSSNKFTSLDPFLLNNLTELTDIWFRNNSITSLPEGFFTNTPKIDWIDLGFNLLKEFHLYDNLVHLTHVLLDHNQIESIKLSAAIQRNITFINLEYNNLTHLDESFQHLINLETLSLKENKLKSFPLCIPGSLTNLYLDHNKLQEIALDKLCGSATQGKLRIVNLSHNAITELNNNSFINLPELLYIGMNNNKIRSIKSGTFSGCPNLIELYLYDNQLADIEPDAFRDLHKLELLILRNNNLTTITSNHFIGLMSLKKLDLSNNKFTSLDPFLLNNLTELTHFWFFNNSITSLPERFFNNTPKLEYLDFNFNLLKEFHLYDNLVHMTHAILEHNQIESIKLSAPTQRNIEFLHLSDNNLTHLDESFQHLINLRELSLNKNKIKSFPLCIPGNLTELDLSHNELHGIALDKFCGSVTQGKLQIVDLSSNQFTSYNLTYTNKSLQETQPDLYKIDLSRNFFNAEIIKFIQVFKQCHKLNLKMEPLRELEVEVNDTKSANIEVNPNDVERKHENKTTENRNEKQYTTWIAVTSAALVVAVFAVIGAILFVCKQRRRTNPNVNDAIMLNQLYDDVGPARADDDDRSSPVYHYPRFPLLYDDVGVQPTYLEVLPDPDSGPQQLEQEYIEPEENHYEEIG